MKKIPIYISIIIMLFGLFSPISKVQAQSPDGQGTCYTSKGDATILTETDCIPLFPNGYAWIPVEGTCSLFDTASQTITKPNLTPNQCRAESANSSITNAYWEGGGKRIVIKTSAIVCTPPKIIKDGACVDTPTPQVKTEIPKENYTLLQPLPCEKGSSAGCIEDPIGSGNFVLKSFDPTTKSCDKNTKLSEYLNIIIKLIIGLCAVAAVVMIVVGGVEYTASELISGKEAAKDRIRNAILGLILALGSYAILFTINPDLLRVDTDGCSGGKTPAQDIVKKELISLDIKCEQNKSVATVALSTQPDKYGTGTTNLKAIATYATTTSDNKTTQNTEDVTAKANWTAIDPTVVEVEKGKITALDGGNTAVAVTFSDNNVQKKAGFGTYVDSCPLSNISAVSKPSTEKSSFAEITGTRVALAQGGGGESTKSCTTCGSPPPPVCKRIWGPENAALTFIIGRVNDGSDVWKEGSSQTGPGIDISEFYKLMRGALSGVQSLSNYINSVPAGTTFTLFTTLNKDRASNVALYQSDKIYSGLGARMDMIIDCRQYLHYYSDNKPILTAFVYPNDGRSMTPAAFSRDRSVAYHIRNNDDYSLLFLHEQVGHQFGLLSDEYVEEDAWLQSGLQQILFNSTNCTRDPTGKKFKGKMVTYMGYSAPIHYAEKVSEGCLYQKKGIYRSSEKSVMNGESSIFSSVQRYILITLFDNYPIATTGLEENLAAH